MCIKGSLDYMGHCQNEIVHLTGVPFLRGGNCVLINFKLVLNEQNPKEINQSKCSIVKGSIEVFLCDVTNRPFEWSDKEK